MGRGHTSEQLSTVLIRAWISFRAGAERVN
jgi:hypothetical protein